VRVIEHMERGLETPMENFQYYKGEGHFVNDYTIEINGERIKGERILKSNMMEKICLTLPSNRIKKRMWEVSKMNGLL